jgi:hypothetical protein
MGMLLEISPDSGFLSVGASGEFSLPEAKRTFLEMLEAIGRHKFRKVLFDGRPIAGAPQTIERFYFGEFAAHSVLKFKERTASPNIKFAYVLREPVLDPQRFGETVAKNRGMSVMAFDNLKDALKWLDVGSGIGSEPDSG